MNTQKKQEASTSRLSQDHSVTIRGARVHNLKNIDVSIPRDQLTVITGPSGSGKSSIAFDIIYAEGQRRYIESLSAYAKQFLQQMSKPDLDSISGLSPTIAIEQKTTSFNPRSTVGTVTEVYDYLRLLFARIAKPYCYRCGDPVQSLHSQQIVDWVLESRALKLSILAPIVTNRKGEYQKELHFLRLRGFSRVKIDGKTLDLSDEISLDKNKKHSISVYIDRFKEKKDPARVRQAVELALKMGSQCLSIESQLTPDGPLTEEMVSTSLSCQKCRISYSAPEPKHFSFNSPLGACPKCDGLGVDPEKLAAWEEEDEDDEGMEKEKEIPPCSLCHGARLKKESLHFKLNEKNIFEICSLSLEECQQFFKSLSLNQREKVISDRILQELLERLKFLVQVGAGYLTLSRSAQSLSGGESQRIRLATQIGSSLTGVIYVLDEPSIGLHQSDHDKLITTLKELRDLGNTVLVVEHDRDTMEQADWILDLGPGAGVHGGNLIASGTLSDLLQSPASITGSYLSGKSKIKVPEIRRLWDPKKIIEIQGASKNNLKNVHAIIPLGVFTCVTGVSGSGKSTLVIDTLYRSLQNYLYKPSSRSTHFKSFAKSIRGLQHVDKVVDIDQKPIGRTPRSNPATYTGIFGLIRDLFAHLPESQVRGYGPGRYSFNVKGGRCEGCGGDGLRKVEMHFLPPVFVECETCRGKRYQRDTLDIHYKGKNIAEVLSMTAEEAYLFFEPVPQLKAKLKTLVDVGLGYLKLGQSATTLSGGEAQRMKLAKELSKRSTGRTIYILDEPSTGLHFEDVKKLISILQTLVEHGNTVVVIEHNLDLIKVADHLIDLGPEGGKKGGEILISGTPEEVVLSTKSVTGRYLKPYLNSRVSE